MKENGDGETTTDVNEICADQFAKFSMHFNSGELKTLRSITNDSSSDRKFIRIALESLYKDGVPLQQKSLFGCKSKRILTKSGAVIETTEKEPLTPKKVKILSDLHSERIAEAKVSESEMALRLKSTYFNQLIATALSNIQRRTVK